MRALSAIPIVLALASCSAPAGELGGGGGTPDQPRKPDPPDKPKAPDMPACTAVDRSAENLQALRRLGFRFAQAIVEGHVGVPSGDFGGGYQAASLDITHVSLGPAFLEGTRVFIDLDEAEAAELDFPGDYLLGFDGNPYPTPGEHGEPLWWSLLVIAPAAERALYDDLLGYRTDHADAIATVKIVAQDRYRTRFRVLSTISGSPPDEVSVNWGPSVYVAPFPGVSEETYLAQFSNISFLESEGIYLGSNIDLRPADGEALDAAARALENPLPELSVPTEFAETYRRSWTFHLSPQVVATSVIGLAGECCTDAGGTYITEEVTAELRGSVPSKTIVRGGHAYDSDEKCGDRFLVGGLGLDSAPPIGLSSCTEGLATEMAGLPVPEIRVKLADTEDNRRAVEGWLAAEEPVYLLSEKAGASPGKEDAGPWSGRVGVLEALAIADLTPVKVLEVKGTIVRVSTPFLEAELNFSCGDPRFLRPGASWLAPLLIDDSNRLPRLDEAGAFFVPGVIFPDHDYVKRIASRIPLVRE